MHFTSEKYSVWVSTISCASVSTRISLIESQGRFCNTSSFLVTGDDGLILVEVVQYFINVVHIINDLRVDLLSGSYMLF
jgi:hypothetical protein